PQELVALALQHDSIGIAYTYTEPTIAYEFVMDTGRLAKKRGLKNVLISNGFVNREPLDNLLEVIDALNIDLKSMADDFYREHCGGRLAPVLNTIRRCSEAGVLVEITNLLIPGFNDSEENIIALRDFVASVNSDIPVHFSGYYPCYKFTAPPTRESSLLKAYEIAREKLPYVYIGNRVTDIGYDTLCSECGNLLVSRKGFTAEATGIDSSGKCDDCGASTSIVGPWTIES
ncbi:MAG TPA: radical SAM protein, partial [candidate division Zixibacteria bacterium]|nr:radical SAM protein [candidate division Zixibacteria bacterium]